MSVHTDTRGDKVFSAINFSVLCVLTLIFLYPLWYCVVASFSDPGQLLRHTGALFRPLGLSIEGYRVVFNNANIWTGYKNTLIYVFAGTAVNMTLTILGAYALSRRRMMFKGFMTGFVAFTMYIGAGLIPNFLLVKNLGLYNKYSAIILTSALSTYNMIVMKTAFAHVPQSLEESAMMDGANDFVILWSILLPVAKATVAVITLFYAVGHWNSWFSAAIYLRDRDKYPLQLFLREILMANSTSTLGSDGSSLDGMYYMEAVIKYCTIIVATVPILCIYPFVQKYFVAGVMLGSLKE